MSDSALSQAEIDALLSGADAGGSVAPPAGGGDEGQRSTMEGFLSGTADGTAGSLSQMTGASVSVTGPRVSWNDRDGFLASLPDKVTTVKADFSSGFPGEHIFLISEDTAKAIAALMNKEDNIELDEMAMSVIGEVVGTIVGSQITALTGKTGNKSIANVPPQAVSVPKATAALPGGAFLEAVYDLNLGDGTPREMWEIFGGAVSASIAQALSGGPAPGPSPAAGMGGGFAPQGSGGMSMGGMNSGGGGQYSAGGQFTGTPSNVQSVQFPSLMPQATPQEQANIGLIMDVFMEMTVELGRTRKLIKEILSMGEGTIIELDKLAGEPVDILVNHKLIAKGEVVVIDENFGVRVTEIVSPQERLSDLG
jgi:flagellar motor switch protein FliN/FliY